MEAMQNTGLINNQLQVNFTDNNSIKLQLLKQYLNYSYINLNPT